MSFVAHHGDLNNNISWGQELFTRGIAGFYGSSDADDWPYSAPNQPPLYILLFGFTHLSYVAKESAIWFLNTNVPIFPSTIVWIWEAKGLSVVYKMFPVWADLGIGYLIYKYFSLKKNERLGFKLAVLWLINPISWYNSAVWGQTDSIVNFLGLLGIFGLLGVFGDLNRIGKLTWFSIWFTLSILFKGSLAIFVPILFVLILKQRHPVNEWFKSGTVSLIIIFAISFWFHPWLDFPIWFIDLYKNRILPGEIGYLTANAFNFWWLVDSGQTLDTQTFFGISARMWSLVISIFGFIMISVWLAKGKVTDKKLFFSLSITSAITFLFMTRIHERYLYPFFPVTTILVGLVPVYIFPYIVFSITYLINMYHLFWIPSMPQVEKLFTTNTMIANILSIVNIFTFGYLFRLFPRVKV